MNPRLLGPRLGASVQQVIRAVKAGDWEQSGERVTAAGIELEPGEYELRMAAASPARPPRCPAQPAWWRWTPR